MDEGEQIVVDVVVSNVGKAADDVAVTAQGDAPVSYDMPTERVRVPPGESRTVQVRLTPTGTGFGHLTFIATGPSGGSVSDEAVVEVRDLPAAAARIVATLEPASVAGKVGQATLMTIRLVNEGSAADVVRAIASSGAAPMSIEPDRIEVALGPGESATVQVRVVPLAQGPATLSLHLTSEKGLDLKPVASFSSSSVPGGSSSPEDGGSEGGQSSGSKASPFLAAPALAAGLALAALAARRRRRT